MKTTKHQIVAVLLVLALILTLAGCSSGGGGEATAPPASEETQGTTPEPADTPEETPDDTDAPETSDTSAEGLPDNLADLTIILDGDTLTLPMPLEDLLALGWEREDEDVYEKTLKPGERGDLSRLRKNDVIGIFAAVANTGDQDITVRQSTVFGISINKSVLTPEAMELPDSIKLDVSTVDDVIAAYGEPTDLSNANRILNVGNANNEVLYYAKAGYDIALEWYTDGVGIVTIDIQSAEISGFSYLSLS